MYIIYGMYYILNRIVICIIHVSRCRWPFPGTFAVFACILHDIRVIYPRDWFSINMPFSKYRTSPCGDKTILGPSVYPYPLAWWNLLLPSGRLGPVTACGGHCGLRGHTDNLHSHPHVGNTTFCHLILGINCSHGSIMFYLFLFSFWYNHTIFWWIHVLWGLFHCVALVALGQSYDFSSIGW